MSYMQVTKQEGQSHDMNWVEVMLLRFLFLTLWPPANYLSDNCPFPCTGLWWVSDDIYRENLNLESMQGMAKEVTFGLESEKQ